MSLPAPTSSAGMHHKLRFALRLREREITPLDECVASFMRDAVPELSRRTLHVIGRWREQRTADAALQCELCATDGFDDDPRTVRRILHREPKLQLHRRPSKTAALEPDEADLVVLLPRDIVGRSDRDIPRIERVIELRLHGLGLGYLFRFEAAAFEHVEEVGVAAGVELIGAVDADAAVGKQARQHAMDDRRADLALDVVADDRNFCVTKSPRPERAGR